MNVASLELCKQLWELSGWEGELFLRYLTPFDDEYAVYTLGYLLRKLPDHTYCGRTGGDRKYIAWNTDLGITLKIKDLMCEAEADTPESALCLLAIKLFHQSILTRKGEK